MSLWIQRSAWPIIAFILLSLLAYSTWFSCYTLPLALLGVLCSILFILHPEKLFWLLIICIPLSFEYQITPSLGTDFPDEWLMLLSVGATLIYLTHYHRLSIQAFIQHPLFYVLLFQCGWMLVSIFHSQHSILSIKYGLSKIWYLIPFVVVPLIVLRSKTSWYRLGYCIFLPILAIAIYTNIRHSLSAFSFQQINEAASPIFRNHVTYGVILSIGFSILAGIWITQKEKRKNPLLLISIFFFLGAIYFSYTRGTWISVVGSLVALPFFFRRKIVTLILIGLFSLFCATGYLISDNHYLSFQPDFEHTIIHDNLSDHLDATYSMKELSTSERVYRWIAAFRMSTKHPLVGFGPATFYMVYKPFTDARFRTYVSENPEKSTVHNYFLLTMVEQGFVGLIILISLLLLFYVYCQRLYFRLQDPFYKTVIVITFLVMTNIVIVNFFSDMIETDKVGTFYFLCLSVILLIDTQQKKKLLE